MGMPATQWISVYNARRPMKQRYHYNVADVSLAQHIEKGNEDSLFISSVASCQNLWALIMDAGTGFSDHLHEKDNQRMSRGKFFAIALVCSFSWYVFPGYLFSILNNMSLLCWAFPNSVTAQQIGSGMKGLGFTSFTLDWSVVASYLGNPLITPIFATVNVLVGYVIVLYILAPVSYWGLKLYKD